MSELKAKTIREMGKEERENKLEEFQVELLHERGIAAMGGAPPNPGRIGSLKRQIARIHTVVKEDNTK